MKLTEILDMFKDFELLTNFSIDDIEILHTTVLDAPDGATYACGNEFVISSGYLFKQNEKEIATYIKRLKNLGCCALGIKVERYFSKIPEEMLKVANELKFPVINIPIYYPFSSVITPILAKILDSKIDNLTKTEEIRNNFIRIVVENKSLKTTFNYLFSTLNIDYIFYDYFLDKKYYNKVFLKNENNFSKSIFSKNKEIGKLILNIQKIELSEFDKTIIDYALEIALIQIEKEITIIKLKENYLNDFISDILSGNIQSKEELLIRAKLFDIDIDGYSSVIIFDIDNYKYSIVQKPLENIKLEEIKRKMFEKIIQNFEFLKSKVLYYKKSDSLVLITKHNSSDNTLLNELEFLVSKLKKIIKSDFNFTFTVGMGNIQKDIMDINKSYEEALDCIKIGRLLEENDGIFKYDDIEFFKILSTTINSSKTPSFINDILKILKYDKEKDTTYFETLNRLIENNWSLKQTSKKQFLHYNTIKYRFEKISEIINKDLNDNNTRFLLELGYRYLKLNKNILE